VVFQGFADKQKMFLMKSMAWQNAQKTGTTMNRAENNGNFALVKSSPQSYPQKEWTAFLLPRPVVHCRPVTESMPFRHG
jgi:hypothetical protein